MSKFQVGDKVLVKLPNQQEKNRGTVKAIFPQAINFLYDVQLDSKIGIWYATESELEAIPAESKFKVGDRVLINAGTYAGQSAVVERFRNYESDYELRFDGKLLLYGEHELKEYPTVKVGDTVTAKVKETVTGVVGYISTYGNNIDLYDENGAYKKKISREDIVHVEPAKPKLPTKFGAVIVAGISATRYVRLRDGWISEYGRKVFTPNLETSAANHLDILSEGV